MEEEERGISIGEIFKIIFRRVWWVIGVTAAVLLVFVCVVQFWYNPSRQTYSAQFELRLPSGSAYPDGTALRLSDSIRLENLEKIKDESLIPEAERKGTFKDIDIDKMVAEDDITLTQVIEQLDDESYIYHNSINVAKKYFKDEDTAVAFLRAVVEFPVTNARYIVKNINYTERLAQYDEYTTYDEKIAALNAQKSYITSIYDGIAAAYGGEYVPAGINSTKSIDEYRRDLINVFNATQQEYISKTIQNNDYYYNADDVLKNLELNIELAQRDIDRNEALIQGQYEELEKVLGTIPQEDLIKQITAFTDKISAYRQNIDSLKEDIAEYNRRIDSIKEYTAPDSEKAGEKAEFEQMLDDIRDDLEERTQTAKSVYIATYNEKAEVIYVNNKITAEGGLNILLAGVIGLILGFVLVSIVILIIDYPKYKRAKFAQLNEAGIAASDAAGLPDVSGQGAATEGTGEEKLPEQPEAEEQKADEKQDK